MMRSLAFLLFICCLAVVSQCAYVWTNDEIESDDAPVPRYHHTAALVANDTFLIFGGFDFDGSGEYLDDTWSYNISTRKWAQIQANSSSSPIGRAYATANTYNSEFILFAGNTNVGIVLGDVWRYSTVNNTWTQDSYTNTSATISAILPRQYHASAIIGHTLYTFGGYTRFYGRTSNSLLAYNLNTTEWTIVKGDKSPGPVGRQAHSLTAYQDPILGDTLILFGGYSVAPYNGGFNDVWQYVISKQSWIQLTSYNAPPIRYSHEAVVLNNTFYIYGGLATFNITKPPTTDVYYEDVWSLKLGGKTAGNWTQVLESSGPGKRQGHAAVQVGDAFYTVGGYVPYIGLENDVWSFRATLNKTSPEHKSIIN